MSRFGFVGPSYKSQSISADNQACVNFYPEVDESGAGNAPIMLYATPGLKLHVDLARQLTPSSLAIFGTPRVASGTGTALSTAPFNAAGNNCVCLFFGAAKSNAAITPGSGFTQLGSVSGFMQKVGAGIITPAATIGSADEWCTAAAIFTLAGPLNLVQNKSLAGPTTGTWSGAETLTLSDIVEGDLLLSFLQIGENNGTPSGIHAVTDTMGNAWNVLGAIVNDRVELLVLYAYAKADGATTVTLPAPAGAINNSSWALYDINGPNGLGTFQNDTPRGEGTNTGVWSTAAGAPSTSPALALGVVAGATPDSYAAGWDVLAGGIAEKIETGSDTYSGTFSNPTNRYNAIIAFFTSATRHMPNLVQSPIGLYSGAGPSTPQVLTGGNAIVAGNKVLVVLQCNTCPNTGSGLTLQSNQGDTLTLKSIYTSNNGSSSSETQIWEIESAIGGAALNLTLTPSVFFPITVSGVSITGLEYNTLVPATSQGGPIRGQLAINGRSFAVSGGDFDEIFANGTFKNWGTVANDAKPVTMAATPQQLLLASAGTAYVFDLQANTLTPIAAATFSGPVAQAGVCDDFFLLTIKDSKEFFVSAPLDATDWVTNGSAIVSVFPDNIVTMTVVHRQIFFASDTKAVFYYDSGNIFPFDVIPGSDMDQGAAAENATSLLYNTVLWLGADERGHGVVWMANGYTPQRVSNHAIETAMQSYARIDDAVSLTMQDQGHYFYLLYFPTADVMWGYDTITGMWHMRARFIPELSTQGAARYQNHVFSFGKHLVGSWSNAKIWQAHIPVLANGQWTFCDDDGAPIVRERIAPHISKEQKYQTHFELQIYVQPGLGPVPPLTDGEGNPRAPEIELQWSDDSGQTWSNIHTRGIGQAGQYKNRARWLRLGTTRDRLYRMRVSDPIGWRIIDAYLQLQPGTGV